MEWNNKDLVWGRWWQREFGENWWEKNEWGVCLWNKLEILYNGNSQASMRIAIAKIPSNWRRGEDIEPELDNSCNEARLGH